MILAVVLTPAANAQAKIIDRIVAVVGEFYILQSDIESMKLQNEAEGIVSQGDMKCDILEEFLTQKLLVNQAKVDSVEVGDNDVEMELDGRLQYFIGMIGSQEALEDYFGKSIIEIKEDMRESVREQLITGRMQGTITADITVTPSETREYYNNLPSGSVPYINSRIETNQITMYPPVNEEAVFQVKQRLLDLRRRILDGEQFSTLAVLYSEDPSSAPRGGEIGFKGRAELDPEYAKAAYSLKKGGVSTIVETPSGYQLIQLIERREDRVNTRNILMKPELNPEDELATKNKLDSIAGLIRMDSLSFELAARMYSQDRSTAVNGGVMINPLDNTTRFEMDQLTEQSYTALRGLKVGDITEAFKSVDENQKEVYKIIRIKTQSEPHRANLKDDYMTLKAMALDDKKNKAFQEWIDEKIQGTFIRIDDSFAGCRFSRQGWTKQ